MVLNSKLGDLEEWKSRCCNLERKTDQLEQLEQDKINLEDIVQDNIRVIQEMRNDNGQLEIDLQNMQVFEGKYNFEQDRNREMAQ